MSAARCRVRAAHPGGARDGFVTRCKVAGRNRKMHGDRNAPCSSNPVGPTDI